MEKQVCQKCKKDRLLHVNGKTSDRFYARDEKTGQEHDGDVLEGLGITDGSGYGDYITFTLCLDCGQIQGKFPVKGLPKGKKS